MFPNSASSMNILRIAVMRSFGFNEQGVRTLRGSMLRHSKSFTIISRTESRPETRATGFRHCSRMIYRANRVTKRDRKINGPPA